MTQRVLKFRAWDGKQMYLSPDEIWALGAWFDSHLNILDKDGVLFQQFTGLHDKDGGEIYEGDISYIAGTGNCFASFLYGAWHWENKQHIFPFNECEEEIIVIGNIHENANLLEAK